MSLLELSASSYFGSILEISMPFCPATLGGIVLITDDLLFKGITALAKSSSSILNNGSNSRCHQLHDELDGCYNDSYAFTLKLIAIASILVAGVSGVATPLIGRKHHFLRYDSNLFVAAKAFAAGVILATGFVHMLPDATSSLTNACLPEIPWRKFPFSGFVAMMAALATLLADLVGTQYYERKQEKQQQLVARVDLECSHSGSGIVRAQTNQFDGKLLFEEEEAVIPLIGTHSHSRHQKHSQEHVAYQGCSPENSHDHSHSHGIDIDDEELVARHAVISQVLEFGIVSHSVIIGLSLGVSRSPCTIGPLLGALSFHQLFEGFALGGCIAQAQFQPLQSTMMACFFALTTPLGIAVGIGISSVYDGSSPGALIIQGLLDSVSAGILVYMALVDLIAANFLNKRMTGDPRLTAVSFLALFFGAVLMSSLAAWA